MTTSALHRYRTYAVLEVGRRVVLQYIFISGTNRPPNKPFDEYLEGLPDTSTANYLRMSTKNKKFNKTELHQIQQDPTCASFDITLLCKTIQFACEGLEPAEIKPRNDLESYIIAIKDWRNECHHGPHEITLKDYQDISGKLKTLFHNALRAAERRYNLTRVDVDAAADEVDRELHKIDGEVLGEDDLLLYCGPQMKMDLINEADAKLKENLEAACSFNPVSFLLGMNLHIDIHDVFTEICVKEGNRGEHGTVISHKNVVSIAREQPGSQGPHVVLVEGLAGSGKTTLMTMVGAEWLEQQPVFTGLNHYSLLLRVQCRDRGVTSLEEFLKKMVPEVYVKFRGLLLPLFQTCRVLFLIDGLDEANSDSTALIDSILLSMTGNKDCTLLFTSRPEGISTFERKIPSHYKKIYLELLGVAQVHRISLVQRYHQKMKPKIGSNQDTTEFLKKVKDTLALEHFRLPLNMMLLTWVCLKRPSIIVAKMSETQLYQSSYDLCVERLVDRVTPRVRVPEQDLRSTIDECLLALQKACLLALSDLQLSVKGELEDHIRTSCEARGVPADDVLSSFLSLRQARSVIGILEKQYMVPHKSMLEFYSALYVVSHPNLSTLPGGIKAVIQDTLGTSALRLLPYQNMFRHVAGLLHQPSTRRLSDELSTEVVDLLKGAGVKSEEQWLDLVEETMAAAPIINRVVHHFPKRSPLHITDSRVWSYTALLRDLPPSEVSIDLHEDLTGKEAELEALISTLGRHMCTELKLHHRYKNPDAAIYSDHILQDVLPRSNLKMFLGHLSADGIMSLQDSWCLTDLCLAVSCDQDANIIVSTLAAARASLLHLSCLHLHVPVNLVTTEVFTTPLPDISVSLVLSGVDEQLLEKTRRITAALQPREAGYWLIGFPGCTIEAAMWTRLLNLLGDAEVRVRLGVWVLKTIMMTDEEERELRHLARTRELGFFERMSEDVTWLLL